MKKLFTLIVLALMLVGVQAQTTVYTANFASGLGSWTTVDNTGNSAGVWQYKSNPVTIPSGGTLTFASATASNGYMLFMSDAATDDNIPEDADLLSPSINCAAHSFVFLEFDQYFRQVSSSSGSVFVSTNGTTWNQVYAVTATSANAEHVVVDITQFAANQPTVYIKFNYQGDWEYFWAVDDVKLKVPVALDISVDTVNMSRYVGISNQTVTGIVTNRGGTTINSFDLGYSDNGGASVYESFSGLTLAPLQSMPFSFTQQINMNTPVQHNIVVTASSPNSGADLVSGNNSFTGKVITLSAVPKKNVLMEEFTTASCVYCTGAVTRLNYIKSRHPELVLAQLHAGFGTDQMTGLPNQDVPDVATAYTTSAPAVMVDRSYYESEGGADIGFYTTIDRWEPYALARKSAVVPVSIQADNTYDSGTRLLTVNASAKFYSSITDNFRINCYILEDSVSGTGSGYNQSNAYNTTSVTKTGTGTAGQNTITASNATNVALSFVATGTGIAPNALVTGISGTTITLSQPNIGAVSGNVIFRSEWYGKGNPIVGYQHRHVVRKMFGGAWGNTSVIPATTAEGVVYDTTYTFILPAGWDENQIELVVLVQHYNTSNKFDRQILNVMEMRLNSADSTGGVISGVEEVIGKFILALSEPCF
ncbi:MAG TPA: Omp28-related outer membrane protein [Bacteroidia bacterium]|nr:Omp28-related outer membrane protein [Bacteroidia bacterium]